jgi:hypothetical protein
MDDSGALKLKYALPQKNRTSVVVSCRRVKEFAHLIARYVCMCALGDKFHSGAGAATLFHIGLTP